MMLDSDERLEDLQCGDLKIIQNKNLYTFTSDSVILANFVKLKAKENAVEIGGGSGVVSILVSAKNKFNSIKIFEIQKELQQICEKNLKLNNLQDKIELIKDDIKNYKKYLDACEVVYSNPPYFKVSDTNENMVKKIAKQEVMLSLDDFVKISSKILKFGGRFYCTYPSERACELIVKCNEHNLQIKKMFFTENGKGIVNLVVVEAVKGGKFGVKVLPNLVTNKSDGEFLEELKTKKFLQ